MPLSQEELYGATKANKKKKSDDTGFFEAAAAGIASGLIKIPESFVSLGAELMDLGLGTEKAKEVEKYFDDLNPFDEIAESRGIGKITEALTTVGTLAVTGGIRGVAIAATARSAIIAKRALEAKKAGKAVTLSKLGRIIDKGEDILTTPTAGAIIGSGVGEAVATDEDIGTLGDMLKGTSLEPLAFTMMNTESKEGRAEAFRRLTNRIKFGTEGALFNLGLVKAGQGVKKLREPATYGLERWKEGGIAATVEKALYGLKPAFGGTQIGFETGQLSLDRIKAAKAEAQRQVTLLHTSIDELVPKLDKSVDLDTGKILNKIQDLMQPLPGKRLESIKLEELPGIIESKTGIKNNARGSFTYKYSGEGLTKELNKEGKELYQDFINMGKDDGISLTGPKKSPMSEQEFITKMTIEAPNQANKYVDNISKDINQTRKLITPEKSIGDQGQMGFFSVDDYSIIKNGPADKFLQQIEKGGGGKKARNEIENIIKTWRSTVDNLTGKISENNLKVNLSKKLHAELGNYLTADYAQFNQHAIPLFRVNRNVAEIKEPALKAYMEQEKNAYRVSQAETLKKTPGKEGIKPEDIVIPQKKLDEFSQEGTSKIERYLRAKNLEELDSIKASGTEDGMKRHTGDAPDKATKKTEKDGITIQTSVLERKRLDEWEEIVLGRVKDPTVTFMSSVSKMASLNYTLDYVNAIAKQGGKPSGRVVVEGGVTKFLNSIDEPIDIPALTQDNLKKGRVKEKFYDENGKFYTPEETLALATKETEDLLRTELNRSQYIFGKGDVMGDFTNAADELVKTGKAKNLEEAGDMLRDRNQFKQVKSTGMDGLSALDGKWMQAPKYDTVFDTTNNWLENLSTLGTIYKYGVLGPKTVSQISKTVLNGLTHVRNFISAGAFVSANGAIIPMGGDLKALIPTSLGGDVLETGGLGEGIIESSRIMSAQRLNPAGKRQRLNPKQESRAAELNRRSAQVGVGGGTQGEAGEIARQIDDFGEGTGLIGLEDLGNKTMRRLYKGKGILKKAYEKTTQLYVEEDTFHKNINWFLERNRYETIFTGLGINKGNFKDALKGKGVNEKVRDFLNDSVERFYDKTTRTFDGSFELFLDEIGGKLTRNNIPNYAYVGRFGRALRMSPFGNFIAFPLEIMRTGSNVVDTAIKEMSSGIPAIKKLGQRRLASFAITVGGIPQALKQTMMAVHDVSNEEMEALRRVVPEWSKNSTLIPAGRDKDGYLKYQDFSYSNAYDFLLRPIRAVNNAINEGKDDGISLKAAMGEGLQDGFSELLQPFASESILSEAVIDSVIRGGVGKDGRRVWGEEDEPFTKMIKAMGHIGKQVVPMGSTFKQLQRISLAGRDKTGEYGEEYKLKDELPGLFGFRITNSNPERSLQFKIGSFGSSLKKTENLFTTPLLKGGRISPQDILEGYQYSESRRFHVLKDMAKNIQAMRDLGMEDYKIEQKLKARKGLGKEVISDLMLGVYTPKSPSNFFIDRVGDINRDLNQKEGISVPNPYYKALPFLNKVINNNRRINLMDEDISFSQLNVGEPTSPSIISKVFNNDGPVRSNVSSATPQLAAAGTNTSLTQPLKVEDVFKTGIV